MLKISIKVIKEVKQHINDMAILILSTEKEIFIMVLIYTVQ